VQRQHARVHLHRQVLAPAERAADAGHREPHLLQRQPERACRLLLVDVQPLGGEVEVDAAVLGRHRESGLRTEEGLVLHADLVHTGHHDGRGGLGVALDDPLVPHDVAARVQPGQGVVVGGALHVEDRVEHLVLDDDGLERLPGDLRVVGRDQRHRLALVPHDVLGQHRRVLVLEAVHVLAGHVLVGQHRHHAG
jgi:hypothetical protein